MDMKYRHVNLQWRGNVFELVSFDLLAHSTRVCVCRVLKIIQVQTVRATF